MQSCHSENQVQLSKQAVVPVQGQCCPTPRAQLAQKLAADTDTAGVDHVDLVDGLDISAILQSLPQAVTPLEPAHAKMMKLLSRRATFVPG